MGFDLDDLTKIPGDEERIAQALSEIERGLKHVDGSDVWGRDNESPGLLMLLEDCVASEYYGIALSVAFDLGRHAAGEKVSVTERQRLAGLATAARNKANADAWQLPGKRIWWEARGQLAMGDKQRKTQPQVAKTIERKVDGVPSYDRAFELVKQWDREARRAPSAAALKA